MKTLRLLAIAASFSTLAAITVSGSAAAQQRGVLNATVRDEDGNGLAGARVRILAVGVDTTVRATDRGAISISLPYGAAQVTASNIGYEASDREIEIDKATVEATFTLRTVARQLAAMQVRENWTGVRGIIGDNRNRLPVAGAEVMVPQLKKKVVTDSLGRFEIPLEKSSTVILQVSRKGYDMRVMSFPLNESSGTDVVMFLEPGEDSRKMKFVYRDLQQRLATIGPRSFVADRDMLARDGSMNVYEALTRSGLLQKSGLKFGSETCLLIDGTPKYGFTASTVRVADIDFIEVYGKDSDIGNSLRTMWGRGQCGIEQTGGLPPQAFERKRFVEYVVVWTRKRNALK